AEDGIRDRNVTGVQTCALPILPFVATMLGTTQVLPGPLMTPKIIAEMMEKYEVTISAGVPTIWLGLLQELNQGSYDTSSLRAILCGGSAAPKSMIRAFE